MRSWFFKVESIGCLISGKREDAAMGLEPANQEHSGVTGISRSVLVKKGCCEKEAWHPLSLPKPSSIHILVQTAKGLTSQPLSRGFHLLSKVTSKKWCCYPRLTWWHGNSWPSELVNREARTWTWAFLPQEPVHLGSRLSCLFVNY